MILRDLDPNTRRKLLGLALATEGLTLTDLPLDLIGLLPMLQNLLIPVRDGSTKRMFATSFHRGAMQASLDYRVRSGYVLRKCLDMPQMLVDGEGNMRNLASVLGDLGTWHVGYSDAFVHLLAAGNKTKSILFDGRFPLGQRYERIDDLLQVNN